ncbi:hypothetical protein GCM10023116_29350 [Kistimonas scapharcae]|uniref:Uncharacterized protein n=1 Tax=Kistimonas scapharcae TaxID=1036133 RepID=A0ABP8V431_9GAMM
MIPPSFQPPSIKIKKQKKTTNNPQLIVCKSKIGIWISKKTEYANIIIKSRGGTILIIDNVK